MRPYITVAKIPNFDPTQLPYWQIYKNEGKAETIQVGGSMAGAEIAGLSGGQRKLLLFEIIYQRTKDQSELFIVMDELFAGVTDDFVPYIVGRLNEMKVKHNVLLVTNDHIEALIYQADNTIKVSAIDRSTVQVNQREAVDREKTILALSIGDSYVYESSSTDLKFFWDVEVAYSKSLVGIAMVTALYYGLFLVSYWNAGEGSQAYVLIAADLISFYCLNPYLLTLVDWRNAMLEEAEALVHSSKGRNKAMKLALTLTLAFVIATLQYAIVNATTEGLGSIDFWVAIMFDNISLTFPLIVLGLYSRLPLEAEQILGTLPFMMLIFFSTTFCPGAGFPYLSDLRYLFPRFYFWCMVPSVQDLMEGCPGEDVVLLYLVLSALLGLAVFLSVIWIHSLRKSVASRAKDVAKKEWMQDDEIQSLQFEMYGEKVLRRLRHEDQQSDTSTVNPSHSVTNSCSSEKEDVKPTQPDDSNSIESDESAREACIVERNDK